MAVFSEWPRPLFRPRTTVTIVIKSQIYLVRQSLSIQVNFYFISLECSYSARSLNGHIKIWSASFRVWEYCVIEKEKKHKNQFYRLQNSETYRQNEWLACQGLRYLFRYTFFRFFTVSKVYLGCCDSCTHWLRPRNPPPAFGLIYDGAIGQPR